MKDYTQGPYVMPPTELDQLKRRVAELESGGNDLLVRELIDQCAELREYGGKCNRRTEKAEARVKELEADLAGQVELAKLHNQMADSADFLRKKAEAELSTLRKQIDEGIAVSVVQYGDGMYVEADWGSHLWIRGYPLDLQPGQKSKAKIVCMPGEETKGTFIPE